MHNNLSNTNEELIVYILHKQLLNNDSGIELEDVNYSNFNLGNLKGIVATIGEQDYVIDAGILSQDINYSGFYKFGENGSDYTTTLSMDVTNAEYSTLYNPEVGYIYVIKKDGVWYNQIEQKIEMSPSCNLIYSENPRELTNNKPKKLVKKFPSEMSSTSAEFISVISLILIIIVTVSITAFLYNMLN